MLAIPMQRTGRKGHAMFRVVVQESHVTPSSGKVVAQLGSYDPHNKTTTLVKDKAEFYLKNGAQPSKRTAALFEKEGIKLPAWYKKPTTKDRTIKNPAKLRKNQPASEKPATDEPIPAEASTPEVAADTADEPTETST